MKNLETLPRTLAKICREILTQKSLINELIRKRKNIWVLPHESHIWKFHTKSLYHAYAFKNRSIIKLIEKCVVILKDSLFRLFVLENYGKMRHFDRCLDNSSLILDRWVVKIQAWDLMMQVSFSFWMNLSRESSWKPSRTFAGNFHRISS